MQLIMFDKIVQKKLLETVKDILPLNTSFVEELADLLQLSTDSVYRRLRGETDLTTEEAALICKKYRISFDNLIDIDNQSVNFSFNAIHSEQDFFDFFKRMKQDMIAINKNKESNLTYAAFDIPLFHHFSFPLLTEFKLFSWMNSILCLPEYKDLVFESGIVNPEMISICNDIGHEYKKIISREIWTENTVNSTLKQFIFYWESGKIKDKEVFESLIKEFKEEIKYIETIAKNSSKLPHEQKTENFQLFISETEIGNNCIQVNLGENNAVYLTHNTFNTLTTYNQSFNSETIAWLENLLKKSEIISGVSQKRRYQFFKNATDKADLFLSKL